MTTATVDRPDIDSLQDDFNAKLESVDALKQTEAYKNRDNLHYYYSAGDFHFILEQGFKPETLENSELSNVPFLPNWYAGILSIHGLIIPVIDIVKFTKTQNLNKSENISNKHYLLKLEHEDHQPIILKLDALPKTINTDELSNVEVDKDSPEWIKSYLQNDKIKLAYVDHNKLFKQLISQQ